jgi:hypothetical protein
MLPSIPPTLCRSRPLPTNFPASGRVVAAGPPSRRLPTRAPSPSRPSPSRLLPPHLSHLLRLYKMPPPPPPRPCLLSSSNQFSPNRTRKKRRTSVVHPGRASASPLGLCAGLAAIALPGPVAPTHPRRQPRLGLHASPAQWPRAPPMPASHAGSGQPSAEPSLPPRESRQPGPAAATDAGAWLGAGAA